MKVFSYLGSIGALLMCVAAPSAQAAVNCINLSANPSFNGTMQLQISTLSVPRDTPVGTRIYLQNFEQAAAGTVVQCDTTSAALTPVLNLQSVGSNTGFNQGFYGGKIYETGVPGIGVAWFAGMVGPAGFGAVGTAQTTAATIAGCTASTVAGAPPPGSCRSGLLKFSSSASMVLIKTGPVGTGTINGGALGEMVLRGIFGDSAPMPIGTLGLRGRINVVSQTCQTPDVTVPMGSYKTSSLTGVGSVTPQVKFVISLTGCPAFAGYYSKPDCPSCTPPVFNIPTASETAQTRQGNLTANTLSIQVDPLTTPVNAANGVLSLTTGSDATGHPMATGVGVQLLDSSGAPRALSTRQQVSGQLSASPNSSINISLGARYLQTANTVTPGKANAVATYTIVYE